MEVDGLKLPLLSLTKLQTYHNCVSALAFRNVDGRGQGCIPHAVRQRCLGRCDGRFDGDSIEHDGVGAAAEHPAPVPGLNRQRYHLPWGA